jgi:hypothetical protein
MARGFLAICEEGQSARDAARIAREICGSSLRSYEARLQAAASEGFLAQLRRRERTGSAENPVTKIFPATVTELRFIERIESLQTRRPTLSITDDREGDTLVDFTLQEGDDQLPINVKNAGTRFENARSLVGLEPDDCLPIPAYKAYAAIEKHGPLLYVISADYSLVERLNNVLPSLFSDDEAIVWRVLSDYAGARVRSAENQFIRGILAKHWEEISRTIDHPPFVAISARKAVRILTTKPARTPGIGLRAWGTGATGEVNVHISIREEATPWMSIEDRIERDGLKAILDAINRRKTEVVYDPEI